MMDVVNSMLQMIMPVSEILMPTMWTCFAAYTSWLVVRAKKYAPLTTEEAKLLWEMHKKKTQCEAKKWTGITRKNRIIGFECGCGYKHTQKRPIF